MSKEKLKKLQSDLNKLELLLIPESKFPKMVCRWIGESSKSFYEVPGPIEDLPAWPGGNNSGLTLDKKIIEGVVDLKKDLTNAEIVKYVGKEVGVYLETNKKEEGAEGQSHSPKKTLEGEKNS